MNIHWKISDDPTSLLHNNLVTYFDDITLFCTPPRKRPRGAESSNSESSNSSQQRLKTEHSSFFNRQSPPAGQRIPDTKVTDSVSVSTIVPLNYQGANHGKLEEVAQNVWFKCKTPCLGLTKVPLKRYRNYLKDPEYIELTHDTLNGKIKEWRSKVLEFCDNLEFDWMFSKETVEKQRMWAEYYIPDIMEGIGKMKLFPVTVLSEAAIIDMVDGVDNYEKAHFVRMMGTCTVFSLVLVRHDSKRNCSVATTFDTDDITKYAYGKGKVVDLSCNLKEQEQKV